VGKGCAGPCGTIRRNLAVGSQWLRKHIAGKKGVVVDDCIGYVSDASARMDPEEPLRPVILSTKSTDILIDAANNQGVFF